MRTFTKLLPLAALFALSSCAEQAPATSDMTFAEAYEFNPRQYICYRAPGEIKIDGKMDEKEWAAAPWTDYFIDIEGTRRTVEPRYKTRAKMMWDDKYVYFAAYLEEPHVWAKLTERESVIFYDNDFEIFLDPNGDSHHYMEFEMNAFATEWDLMLTKPYRDKGNIVLDSWNINGIKSAAWVDGTINNGKDIDKGWSVEIAMPIESIIEADNIKPAAGAQWRVNFSRVEWFSKWENGDYKVIPNELTGKEGMGGEDNWVWSPQGAVAMHQPETWGFMQFSDKVAGTGTDAFVWNKDEDVKWALRKLYLRMKEYEGAKKEVPTSLSQIAASDITVEGFNFNPTLTVTETGWVISSDAINGARAHIADDGRTWVVAK